MYTNSHAIMRVAERLPTAEPLIDALYVSAQSVCMLVSALCCAVASHQCVRSKVGGSAPVCVEISKVRGAADTDTLLVPRRAFEDPVEEHLCINPASRMGRIGTSG